MKTRVVHVNDNVPGAVYIGRRNNRRGLPESEFANPFKIGKHGDREEVCRRYREELWSRRLKNQDWWDALADLVGKPLACWCRRDGEPKTQDNMCHGDVLVALIEELGLEEATS